MEQLQANFKLAVYIFTITAIVLGAVIVYLVASVDELEKKFEDMCESLHETYSEYDPYERESIPLEEINDLRDNYEALKGMVEKQSKQIENMVFCYSSLDEILKQLGGDAQKRYMKKVGE